MIIQSKNIWIEEQFKPAQIEIHESKITSIYQYNQLKVDRDYGDLKIYPGFISVHDHGYGGLDANHPSKEFLIAWSEYLLSEGITSFYPTTSTLPFDELIYAFTILGDAHGMQLPGANYIGIHAEGPFFSKDSPYRGSHNPNFIEEPTLEKIKRMYEASNRKIRIITLAPELENVEEVIDFCIENDIKVSIGHTGATFDETERAVERGATNFTHTFNGMRELKHREPGASGAALYFDNCFAEMIPDGMHIHDAIAKIIAVTKGDNKLITVTDSIFAKGMPEGSYYRAEKKSYINVDAEGTVRLESGKLAGSTNKMNKLLQRLISVIGVDEITAINSITSNPATYVGLDTEIGKLAVNYDADITILNEDYEVVAIYVKGIEKKEDLHVS